MWVCIRVYDMACMYACACVRACARARVCVRACIRSSARPSLVAIYMSQVFDYDTRSTLMAKMMRIMRASAASGGIPSGVSKMMDRALPADTLRCNRISRVIQQYLPGNESAIGLWPMRPGVRAAKPCQSGHAESALTSLRCTRGFALFQKYYLYFAEHYVDSGGLG